MRKALSLLSLVALGFVLRDSLYRAVLASGIVPAILPSMVPAAYRQGNGTKFQLGTGSPTSGNCAGFDLNGNVVDVGTCGSGTPGPAGPAGAPGKDGFSTALLSDSFARVPATAPAGTGFLSADGPYFLRSIGTGWQAWAYSRTATIPDVASSWTQVNFTGCTADSSTGPLIITAPGTSVDQARALVKPTPASPPYTITLGVRPLFTQVGAVSHWNSAGLVLRNASSQKLIAFSFNNGGQLQVNQYTNSTTWAAQPAALTLPSQPHYWLKVRDDSANRIFSFSIDKTTWQTLYTETRTTFTTPDQWGPGVLLTNDSKAGSAEFFDASVATDLPVMGTYLASWFSEADKSLQMMTSADASTFTLWPTTYAGNGSLRDPSVFKYASDGKYYVVHTHAVTYLTVNHDFIIASSTDASNWTAAKTYDVAPSIAGVNRVWAPEWFVDPADASVHVFFAASTNNSAGPFSIYEVHPTTPDLTATWSSPAAITVNTLSNLIDAFVVKEGTTYYLWFAQQTGASGDSGNYVGYATSSSLTGPYTLQKSGDWAGWGKREGPALIKIGSTWRLYFDDYLHPASPQERRYADSSDTFATWTPETSISSPISVAQGTVMKP